MNGRAATRMAGSIATPADVDAGWMTARLREAGVVRESAVTALRAAPVGNGLVGTSLRYALSYDTAEPGAPASVVGKFPATDATSRQSGDAMRLYLRETSFYRQIAPTVGIRTPRVLVNQFDPATQDFLLLFEDMSPARGGDQLCGCAVEDAHVAMLEIAALHGPRWNDPALDSMEWLGTPASVSHGIVGMLQPLAEMFRERYAAVLAPEVTASAMGIVPFGHAMLFGAADTTAVVHGDYRLDNVLFDAQGGTFPMATLDWQTVGRGCGTRDVSYFLGSGLRAWDRAAHEADLVRVYHAALLRHGVTGYEWDECWYDYRKHSLDGLLMAVVSAASVARTARGDDMFLTMARRHAAQALELGAFGLWDA